MKIVVAGAGEVGTHLAKMLSQEYHDIVIVDSDEDRLNHAAEVADVVTIAGKPTSIRTLTEAGADRADLFIAVSPAAEQDVNLVSALLAKKMGAKKVTARINSEEYQTNENKLLFIEMGIDSLFYPEKIAANEIVNLLKQAATSEFMDYSHGKLQLVVFRLEDGAPLIGKSPQDFVAPDRLLYRSVAISRNGETIIPRKDTRFKYGDMVYLIAKKEGVADAVRYSGKNPLSVRNLMILGGGRIGEIVARKMEKLVQQVKLVEIRPERCNHLTETLDRTLVINGDGRNSDVLIEENVRDCDAFVAVTSSSETNILSCVMAKRMGVAKVIAEVENFEYIKLAEGMGVDAVINKKLITAGRIFRYTLSNKVRSIKVLNGTDAEVLEFIVNPDSLITKAPLRDLHFPEDALIGGVIRGNDSFIAVGDSRIKPYDQVVVFAQPSAVSKVDKFFL